MLIMLKTIKKNKFKHIIVNRYTGKNLKINYSI